MHLLFLLGEFSPGSLLLQGLGSGIGSVLLRQRLLLFALHGHLLHLLFHDQVLLLLLEEHELLMLSHSFQLVGSHFGIKHELLVTVLEGVAL